ncbi:hypothetical protein OG979_28775 [Actinomadura citrea]|uniref:hypothetical protein n=1 Tax=Actinomadura citrea TaxID=46158 RepID=UPI002E2DE0E5|nr:hypothetical protein [Actinomadura citrea]
MIHALVPLSMYSVRYELAFGRPYGRFEELLLHAVAENARGSRFAELRECFQLHDRLLTEGLVTLIQEGWVAMEQVEKEIHYLVTEEGRETVASGRRPSNLKVRSRHATIVRERLTGQLAAAKDLIVVSAARLRGANGRSVWREALRPRMSRMAVNGGEVERFLPRGVDGRQEWIRWIDSATRVSQDLHYLPVRVDTEERRVLGLPYNWLHLEPLIVDEVEERAEALSDEQFQEDIRELIRSTASRASRRARDARTVTAESSFAVTTGTCDDIALTAAESRAAATGVLDRCSGHALLVVGRLTADSARGVRDAVVRLVSRGVQVDLLWSSADHERTKEAFSVLSAARAQATAPGAVVFNTVSAQLPADLLLATTSSGPEAVVGPALTCTESGTLNPSIRLTDRAVLAALARLAAGWWTAYSDSTGTLPPFRWKHFAEEWAGEAAISAAAPEPRECRHTPGTRCTGELTLLTGPRHRIVESELSAEPGPRLLVADGLSTVGEVTDGMMAILPAAVGSRYRIFGGREGWRIMRRTVDGWIPPSTPDFAPASPLTRIVAVRDRWLVHSAGGEESSLAYVMAGHLASTAWKRTS